MLNTERLCLGCMNDGGGEKICPICGFDSSSQNPENCLPLKFKINDRYIIGKVNKINGEGITYIGWDNASDTIIDIKEYFPDGFAHRNPDKTVSIKPDGKYTFNEGLMEFIEINRRIMNSDLPSLIPVTDVFEENGTVYAVSKNIPGISLEEFLNKNGNSLKWEQARALLLPLIDTIKGMNDYGIIHGGISAETIIVGRDGKLRISDYSIRKLRMLTSELKTEIYTGFAATEQYDLVGLHIDKYTDVYGLSATLFRVFIGITPPDALIRMQNDTMTVPAKFAEELPRHVLASLANGLQILPENRTADIETFKNELVYGEVAAPVVTKKNTETDDISSQKVKKSKGSSVKYVVISSISTALVFCLIVGILALTVFKDAVFKKDTSNSDSEITSVDAPIIQDFGTVDSDVTVSTKTYNVKDFTNKFYSEIINDADNEPFEFVIKDKQYSNKYPKGTICSQSVKANSKAPRDTKIELVISLGPKEIKIANLDGYDENTAKIVLLQQGFLYENIIINTDMYDEEKEPGTVLDQSPKYGDTVNTEVTVTVYINGYKGDDDTSQNSDGSDENGYQDYETIE